MYILTNRKSGALYTGVCADMLLRRYGVDKLVHVEFADDIRDAIAREAIKKWGRAWKSELIERDNPEWRDLWFDLNR